MGQPSVRVLLKKTAQQPVEYLDEPEIEASLDMPHQARSHGRPSTRFQIPVLRRPRGRSGDPAGWQCRGSARDLAYHGDAPAAAGVDLNTIRAWLCHAKLLTTNSHAEMRRKRVRRPDGAMARPEAPNADPPHPLNARRDVARYQDMGRG